jgi:hypothetical protein
MEEQSQDTPKDLSEKERINQILSDPNTTDEVREDIKCHLTGIVLAQMLSEDEAEEPIP